MTQVEFHRELSIWADFNAVDAQQRVTTSLRFADAPERPAKGELVLLYDDEGNSVQGVVDEVMDLAVHVLPLMETWANVMVVLDAPFPSYAPFRAEPQGEPAPTGA